MKPVGQQSNYKRKTLLRRRAYKLGRERKAKGGDEKPKTEPDTHQALDQISLPQ